MNQIIKVTKRDITRGERNEPNTCPIALACKRVFPKHKDDINIDPYEMRINGWRMDLPMKAANFVSNFDEGEEVEPFEFVFRYRKSK